MREALLDGMVDTLVNGMDETLESAKCTSGAYQVTKTTITFNNCAGIFASDEGGTVSGSVDISKGYDFKNFTIKFPDGRQHVVSGLLEFNDSDESIFTNQLLIAAKELNANKKLIDVNYTLSNYKLILKKQDANNAKIQLNGKLESKGGEHGDFKVAFSNDNTPFYLKINSEEEVVGSFYAGTMTIYDLNKTTNVVTITAINADKAQHKAVVNGKVLFDEVKTWTQILDE
ncbi:hypothetical protein [Acinetobacter sp. Marseille-Q1618]|uniref:hypothetical protein n=1 Tax=Acinetobacter sp. Marseille-Q1618 TaxID=2697502 RepID=UPI00157042C4|nr:hypothetical protein [Acinetobacter sp. Marseille-Q1618]